ncbi:hypothetical protein PT974_03608 [Cladobotryum mycophilum]|uniref:Heterokaryon incompatibility domain-containing protein n=1 Tax=Cladobotryum mycophilum TaxID=491253 RepID=A0ABR0SU08_9HYPO
MASSSSSSQQPTPLPPRSRLDNSSLYRSLPLDSRSIRLVRLRGPGVLELQVFKNIFPAQGGPPPSHVPTFYAISYCWSGSPQDAHWSCNGEDLLTTRTLHDLFLQILEAVKERRAMRQSYFPKQPFIHVSVDPKTGNVEYPWLWIDQICINQNDQAEKVSQIGLMTSIYFTSQQTIVWLGSGGDTSDLKKVAADPQDLSLPDRFHLEQRERQQKQGLPQSRVSQQRAGWQQRQTSPRWPGFQHSQNFQNNHSFRHDEFFQNNHNFQNDQFFQYGQEQFGQLPQGSREWQQPSREGYGAPEPPIARINEGKALLRALVKLMSLPWFSRTWVLQEVALSPKTPMVVYGTMMLDWSMIFKAISYAESLTPSDMAYAAVKAQTDEIMGKFPQAFRNMKAFALLTSREPEQSIPPLFPLQDLLLLTPCFQATVAHDRVVGLLGLAKEARLGSNPGDSGSVPAALRVNYQKPFEEWTSELTRYIIENSRSLRIWWLLREKPRLPNLPSWAVDFGDSSPDYLLFAEFRGGHAMAQENVLPELEVMHSALCSKPGEYRPVPQSDDKILVVEGRQFDTIQAVGPPLDCDENLVATWKAFSHAFGGTTTRPVDKNKFKEKSLLFVWAWFMKRMSDINPLAIQHPGQKPFGGSNVMRALCVYMIEMLEKSGETTGPWVDELKGIMTQSGISSWFSSGDYNPSSFMSKLERGVLPKIKQSRPVASKHAIFWTEGNRHVGQGPSRALPGDIICALDGGESPMILRSTGSGATYQLIGPCYIAHDDHCPKNHGEVSNRTFQIV